MFYNIYITSIPKEKLAKAIDTLIDASVQIHKITVTMEGLSGKIDKLSTELYFHYNEDNKPD